MKGGFPVVLASKTNISLFRFDVNSLGKIASYRREDKSRLDAIADINYKSTRLMEIEESFKRYFV